MRSILSLFLVLSSVSLVHARDIRLNCDLRYDIDHKEEISIPATILDGKITFEYTQDDARTYFFPMSGPAVWHSGAQITFRAELINETLIYSYDFKNYLRDRSTVVSVFNETRFLNMDFYEIDKGQKHYFDFRDGKVLTSEINNDDWINDNGIELDSCEIFDKDLYRLRYY